VIANLAVIEFMAMITGLREPRPFLMYHADRGILNDRRDARDPTCYTCGYLVGKRESSQHQWVPASGLSTAHSTFHD
jgi:molybdopterin-synthase adenylyltransferase